MKILMVLESEFPTDNRVEKEMISLAKAGHQIDLACYTRKNKAHFEQHEFYNIHRFNISPLQYKMSAAILVLPFYLRIWKKFVLKLHNKNNYDAIHIHDLPLAKLGYIMKKKFGIPLICDQHEYYSNWIVHTAHYNTLTGKIIKILSNWKSYENKYLNKADLVVTVEEPLKQCYINDVKVDSQKIIILPNTPEKDVFNNENIDMQIIEKYKSSFMLFYAGGIDRLRGLEMVIKAMAILKNKIPDIKLVIAGRQAKGFSIVDLAKSHNVESNVEFLNWIPHTQIATYIAASKVGFFTPPGNRDEIHNTIATKIYQYVAMGVPIIVSNVRLMAKFVTDYNIGFVAENEIDFAKFCLDLASDENLRSEKVANCNKIKDKYYWESSIQELINFYNKQS